MSGNKPLPAGLPGTLTLDQLKDTVEAFGWQLALEPKPEPTPTAQAFPGLDLPGSDGRP